MTNTQVQLKQLPKYHHFQGVFKEYLDAPLLDLIIKKGHTNIEINRSLITLHNSINKKNNILSVSYEYAGGKCGRHYPKFSKSIICQYKKAKHTMFEFLGYSDLDMVKGHPTIAVEMARTCGMEPLEAVQYYLDNFDTIVKTVSQYYSADKENPLDEGDVKQLFNSIIYGGSVEGWKKDIVNAEKHENPKQIRTVDDLDIVVNFKNDIVKFNDEVYKNNRNLTAKVTKYNKDKNDYDKKGTTASYWFQIIENELLYKVVDFLLNKGIITPQRYRLEFDGICIPPSKIEYDKKTLADEINNHVYETTGLKILFKFKDYKPENIYTKLIEERKAMSIPEIVDTSEEESGRVVLPAKLSKLACDVVLNRYKNKIVRCGGVLYVKYNDVWIGEDPVMANDVLKSWMREIDIWYYNSKGIETSYTGEGEDCDKIIKDIRAELSIIDDDFINKTNRNNKNYLPFKNGIYSFVDKTLYEYDELPNVNFFMKINRNYPVKNENAHKRMMDKVIEPIYPDATEREYNAHCKARALSANFEDKVWYMYIGSRNSGKGVETDLMKKAFGEYVSMFDSSCLIYSKEGKGKDPAKELGWLLDKRNARVLLSSEIRGKEGQTVLDGGLVKMLASGGDAVEARKLYNNAKGFVPQSTIFICCNAFYSTDPFDATENLEQFDYKSKFVGADELIEGVSYLKLKDDKIKDLISEDSIIDAYTLYILDAYKAVRDRTPKAIKNAIQASKPDEKMTAEQFILKRFKTTLSDKDRLHTDAIYNIIDTKGFSETKMSVAKIIGRVGIGKYNDKCNIEGVRKCGYNYIKFIEDDEWDKMLKEKEEEKALADAEYNATIEIPDDNDA
jgi:hypothetical protein